MAEPKTAHEIKLLKAVNNGLIRKTRLLLSLHSIQVNDERYFDYHLIIKAIDKYNIELAKLLIEEGFRVYKKSKTNQEITALHAAVKSDNLELLGILLANGASPDILTLDEQDKTPLHLAIDNYSCMHIPIIHMLLRYCDAKDLDDKYLLHYAVKENDVYVVSELIEKGVSLKKRWKKNVTPFCVAILNNNYNILKSLLSQYAVERDINSHCHDDVAPAYIASLCGDSSLIKRYIDSGLCVNSPLELNSDTWSCFEDCSGFTLLHFGVKNFLLEIIKYLLSIEADIFIPNDNGSSPLHLAFETKEIGIWKSWQDFHNNNSIIDLLLDANIKFNSNPDNKHGLTHFHIACSRDEPKVVEHFLKLGAPVNQPVDSQSHLFKGFSPLHYAAKFRCIKTVELLLKNGADVRQRDFQNMTALHIAAKESCLDIVNLLLQYGADVTTTDSFGNTPLHLAFDSKNYQIIDRLLLIPNLAQSNPTNGKGVSHFHIACTRNNVNVVKSFIKKKKEIIDTCVPVELGEGSNSKATDWSNYSPLYFAVSYNRTEIVQLLVRSGANDGLKDKKGQTPLHLVSKYTLEMFEEYIENVLRDSSKHKKNVIQVKQPLTDVVKVDEKNEKFMGCIEKINWSFHRKNYLKILNLLLDYGSDVNCIDNDGHASLFHAYSAVVNVESTMKSHLDLSRALRTQIVEIVCKELRERRKLVINILLERGANMDKCFSNKSILHFAISNYETNKNKLEMITLFLKKGADVDAEYDFEDGTTWTPLSRAPFENVHSVVGLLLKYNANVDCIIDPKSKLTPLLVASKMPLEVTSGNFTLFIVKSRNVNARQSDGKTALHNLASLNMRSYQEHLGQNIELAICTLIAAGADVNIRDSRGQTPLHVACEIYSAEFISLMLHSGADINIEDNDGRSVCCCLYDNYRALELPIIGKMMMVMDMLQSQIIKMSVIGLPPSEKMLTSMSNCFDALLNDRRTYEVKKMKLKIECEAEVRILKETKIHGNCSLYDAIFKDDNTLSHLVKNSTFEAIVKSEVFEEKYHNYGYLVAARYKTGLDRKNLLPAAKCVLNDLAGVHLPDSCAENIFKYFSNVELKELTEMLGGELDSKMKNSDCMQLRSCKIIKRQKVD